jgi:hypothetical protein
MSKQTLLNKLKKLVNKKGKPLLKVSKDNSLDDLQKFNKYYEKLINEDFNPAKEKTTLNLEDLKKKYNIYKNYNEFIKDERFFRQAKVSIFGEKPENLETGYIKEYRKQAKNALNKGLDFSKFTKNVSLKYLQDYNTNVSWKYRITYQLYGEVPETLLKKQKSEYIKFNGREYRPLTQSPYYEFVESIFDLTQLYPSNTMIKIYTNDDFSSEFEDFVNHVYRKDRDYITEFKNGELITQGKTELPTLIKNSLPGSEKYMPTLIKILNIHRSLDLNKLTENLPNLGEIKLYDYTQPKIYSPYINYDYDYKTSKENFEKLFLPTIEDAWLEKNNLFKGCVISSILHRYKESWDKYKKQPLTKEFLMKFFQVDEDDMGVSLEQLKKFIEKYNLRCKIFDRQHRLLFHNEAPTQKKINKSLYAIYHNRHLYIITNINDIKHVNTRNDKTSFILNVSSQFRINTSGNEAKQMYLPNFYDIIKYDLTEYKKYQIITNTPLLEIFMYFYNKLNYIPCVYRSGRNLLTLVRFKVGENEVSVSNPDQSDIGDYIDFDNEEQFKTYMDLSKKMKQQIFNNKYKSAYHPTMLKNLKTCCATPIVGKFNEIKPNYKVDIIKCYSSILYNLPSLLYTINLDKIVRATQRYKTETVKNGLRKIEYEIIEAKITPYNFYIFEYHSQDCHPEEIKYILLRNQFNLFFGYELLRNNNFLLNLVKKYASLTHYCEVNGNQKHTEVKSTIKEIFNNEILKTKQKKFIINSITGLLEKQKNSREKMEIYTDITEAQRIQEEVNKVIEREKIDLTTDIYPLEGTPLNIFRSKKDVELQDGFYLIKLQIYSQARILMFDLFNHIKNKYNAKIHSIKTDCLYFYSDNVINEPQLKSTFDNIGKFNIETLNENDMINLPKCIVKRRDNSIDYIIKDNTIDTISFDSEIEYLENNKFENECIKMFETHKKVIVKAEVAGGGKTSICCKYLNKSNKRIIISSGTNKRLIELKFDPLLQNKPNIVLKTIHSILKIRIVENELTNELIEEDSEKMTDLSEYDLLFIDELALLDMNVIQKLNKLLLKFPNLQVLATSDTNQQDVDKKTTNTSNRYKENKIDEMFDKCLMLWVNKRMETKEDRINYSKIKDILLKQKNRKEIFKYVNTFDNFNDIKTLIKGGKCITYTKNLRDFINNEIHLTYLPTNKIIKVGMYDLFIGCNLSIKKTIQSSKYTLHINQIYPITRIDDDYVYLLDYLTKEEYPVKRSYFDTTYNFTFDYCFTTIATQGDTYKNVNVIIFEYNHHFMSAKALYTAIGRANSLKNVFIYTGPTKEYQDESRMLFEENYLKNRIASHKTQDKKVKREFDENDYVNIEWIITEMENDGNCWSCNTELVYFSNHPEDEVFSIDRINDSHPHTKNNCRLSCLKCNVSHKNKQN